MTNPLRQYFRQPKIFIGLPSKGLYYQPGSLEGDYSNMPVFAMTGMDEIIMKTPDALFSGEATVKLIESCCPYIKDAHQVPSLDVDALLIAIRIATFGEIMNVNTKCKNCEHENDYEVSLPNILDRISNHTFENTVQIDDLVITLKPLSYKEMIAFNLENFRLQKMLLQLSNDSGTEEERQATIDDIYAKLAKIQASLLVASIESIKTPDGVAVSEKEFITEWLTNSSSRVYNTIKTRLETNKTSWEIPAIDVKCNECGHTDQLRIELDQSSFFG